MALEFAGIGGSTLGVFLGAMKVIGWLILGAILIGGAFFWRKVSTNKKAYNIPVTIFIPRSDNKTRDVITCKGGYFKSEEVGGITTFRLKRPGLKPLDIPPPSSQYLMGQDRHLYLVQKGMDDFEPILPESFSYVDTQIPTANGETKKVPVVNLRCINQDATAWRFDNEANAKKRFTLSSFWEKYKDFIQITIFILIVFIAMFIQYKGLTEVAESLKNVAGSLKPLVGNAPVVN